MAEGASLQLPKPFAASLFHVFILIFPTASSVFDYLKKIQN
jgi:hypothetical protein